MATAVEDGWAGVTDKHLADFDSDGAVDIIGRVGDTLLVWRTTATNGVPTIHGGVSLRDNWNSIGYIIDGR